MVIQRDSCYYLKNQRADLERQVDVLGKINEDESFIDGICLGLDIGNSSSSSDNRRRKAIGYPGLRLPQGTYPAHCRGTACCPIGASCPIERAAGGLRVGNVIGKERMKGLEEKVFEGQ